MPLDRNKIKCSVSQRPLLILLWLYLFKMNIKNINIWTFDLRPLHWSSLFFFLLSLFSYFPFCPKPLLHSSVSLPPPFVHLLVMQSPPLPLPPSLPPLPFSLLLCFVFFNLFSPLLLLLFHLPLSSSYTLFSFMLPLPSPPPLIFPPRRWDLPPGGVDHCL